MWGIDSAIIRKSRLVNVGTFAEEAVMALSPSENRRCAVPLVFTPRYSGGVRRNRTRLSARFPIASLWELAAPPIVCVYVGGVCHTSPVDDDDALRVAIAAERARMLEQLAGLQRSFADIVEAAELTSTDDEHDPEGATIAYERALVSALLLRATDDLVALDRALERVENGTIEICASCHGPIARSRLFALPAVKTCITCAR
jgi:DnaK suppressor protein